jgi:opacity protein-like surface antigen
MGGNGYHVGASVGVSIAIGEAAVTVNNSYRYTRFASLDWTEDKSIVPPAGWPTSMDLWTGTVRLGVAIGVPE